MDVVYLPQGNKSGLAVYPEQQSAAHAIMSAITDGVSNIVLRAKPQCGKTTTFIFLAHLIMQAWEQYSEKYTIYSVLADANNELLKQTKERWAEAGFNPVHYENKIKHYHRAQFKKAEISKDDIRRLIIIDEAHLANKKGSQLDDLLKNIDFDYKTGENTGTCKNYIVSVSATPYGHMASYYSGLSNFMFIELKTSPDYYGIEHAKDRIRKALSVDVKDGDRKILNPELKTLLQLFAQEKTKKNLVIRLSGSRSTACKLLKQFLTNEKIRYHEFHSVCNSDKVKSLSEVDGAISTEPLEPTVIIIYGALRAGKTLGTTKYIYAWVDSNSIKADTVYQSVGRMFGYTADGHSKFDDTFPIYSNLNMIQKILENQDTDELVPPGVNNRGSCIGMTYGEPRIAEQDENGKYLVYDINQDGFPEKVSDGAHTMSKNKSRDFAKFVLTGAQWDYRRTLYCDGPAEGFEKSWEEFNEQYPEFVGKHIVREPISKDFKHGLDDNAMYS